MGGGNHTFNFRHAELKRPIGYPHENVSATVGNKGLRFRKKIEDAVNFMDEVKREVRAETTDVKREPRFRDKKNKGR